MAPEAALAHARRMTSEQLLDLGMNQVVYLKSGICEGKMLFVLFGANGTPVIAADNVDAAVETAIRQGLIPADSNIDP